MSHDPRSPSSAPWSPHQPTTPSAPTGTVPPVAPHRHDPWPSTPPASDPTASIWDPAPSSSSSGPPPPSTPGPRRERDRPRRSAGTIAAVAVLSAMVAGSVGGVVGARLADQDAPSTAASSTAQTATVSTEVPPLDGSSPQPAQAVAAVLAPAVVQIETTQGLGSGFIYDGSGLILTAHHVTDGASQVQVRLADGTRTTGTVVGSDPSTDVAVVQIDPVEGMAVATLATGVDVEVGQTAIAIGSPFGLDQTVTAGIVSAVGRSAETPGGVIPAIQTDAPINSGNSGGALADANGRVIGINDSIATGGAGSTGNLGIGFAIPIDIAKSVADRIVAGESTEAGFLGVEGTDATGSQAGAAIGAVTPGSPADDAGIAADDVVVAVDGVQVSSMIDLGAKIRTHQPGESVTITVLRGGQQLDLDVTLVAATGN